MAWIGTNIGCQWGLPDEEISSLRHYFLYRGFYSTAKAFENELKQDKEKAFRIDKIMDQIVHYISTYDIMGLKDYWNFLETRVFSCMDPKLTENVPKLHTGLLRYYVAHAQQQGKSEKVVEFFDKMSADLSSNAEWREWFMIPFLKNPETNNAFEMYFNKQWQDTLILSLHNFICLVLCSMKKPAILGFGEDKKRIDCLELENARLKMMIDELTKKCLEKTNPVTDMKSVEGDSFGEWEILSNMETSGLTEFLDDFHEINSHKREEPLLSTPGASPIPIQYFSNLLKNFAGNSSAGSGSPKLLQQNSRSSGLLQGCEPAVCGDGRGSPINKNRSLLSTLVAQNSSEMETAERGTNSTSQIVNPGSQEPSESNASQCFSIKSPSSATPSQEIYSEHGVSVVTCRISPTGNYVSSLDMDGLMRIWSSSPFPKTMFGSTPRSVLTALEWHPTEKYVLLGSKVGDVRLFDLKERKITKEVRVETNFPRLASIAVSPDGSSFVTSSFGRALPQSIFNRTHPGLLTLWDLDSDIKFKRFLPNSPGPVAINCMTYNYAGNMLLTGGADGKIRLYDIKSQKLISDWQAHDSDISTVSFASKKSNSCYSFGANGMMIQWSLLMMGNKLAQYEVEGTGNSHRHFGSYGLSFALNSSGSHVLVGWQNSATIYKFNPKFEVSKSIIEVSTDPITCVDWSDTSTSNMCVVGTQRGSIVATSLNHNAPDKNLEGV